MEKYLQEHETAINDLMKKILATKIEIDKCRLITDTFRPVLRMVRDGMDAKVFNEEDSIKGMRSMLNETLKSNYAFDFTQVEVTTEELIEVESLWKKREVTRIELSNELKKYLADNPPPKEFVDNYYDDIKPLL